MSSSSPSPNPNSDFVSCPLCDCRIPRSQLDVHSSKCFDEMERKNKMSNNNYNNNNGNSEHKMMDINNSTSNSTSPPPSSSPSLSSPSPSPSISSSSPSSPSSPSIPPLFSQEFNYHFQSTLTCLNSFVNYVTHHISDVKLFRRDQVKYFQNQLTKAIGELEVAGEGGNSNGNTSGNESTQMVVQSNGNFNGIASSSSSSSSLPIAVPLSSSASSHSHSQGNNHHHDHDNDDDNDMMSIDDDELERKIHLPPHFPPISSSSTSFSPPSSSSPMEDDAAIARRLQSEEENSVDLEKQRIRKAEEEATEAFLRSQFSCCSCHEMRDSMMDMEKCGHVCCKPCLQKHLLKYLDSDGNQNNPKSTGKITCPYVPFGSSSSSSSSSSLCYESIPHRILHSVLKKEQADQLIAREFEAFVSHTNSHMVSCPNCKKQYVAEANNNNLNAAGRLSVLRPPSAQAELDDNGVPLTAAALTHRSTYRFRCPDCSTNFCSSCLTTPYHLGKTCEEWKSFQSSAHCRSCGNAMPPVIQGKGGKFSTHPLFDQFCTEKLCIERRDKSCEKKLPCGHFCRGIKGETACLPCIEEGCPANPFPDVNVDEYCCICGIDGLGAAPCVKLGCGHLFHHHCMTQKIEKRWPGARITFGFLDCPLCKKPVEHPSFAAELKEMNALRSEIQDKSLKRLELEGMLKDSEVTDPKGRYYKNPSGYSMDRFAYYPCFKCKKPFYGGRRQCGEALENANAAGGGSAFKADELICGGCTSGGSATSCKIHGTEFIDWKCKFCCNPATWFCWGNTHFCQSCHERQVKGDYVSKIPKDKLPKCEGAGKCPLAVKHPVAGDEFCVGCAICRPRDY